MLCFYKGFFVVKRRFAFCLSLQLGATRSEEEVRKPLPRREFCIVDMRENLFYKTFEVHKDASEPRALAVAESFPLL